MVIALERPLVPPEEETPTALWAFDLTPVEKWRHVQAGGRLS